RDRIIHCNAFRRLKHKTQMLLSPAGDHYRTRLTHTMEVSQIARTIARALRLNEDLTEAIALGHDLGHTPFGHSGERTMSRWLPGFTHAAHSLRVVDVLEREGQGLNLTWEVRDGIANHTGDGGHQTLEGAAVSLSDRIAYINHDIDDAVRCGLLQVSEIPQETLAVVGKTHGERISAMIRDVVAHSQDRPAITMGAETKEAMERLRQFLFQNVYCKTIDEYEEKRTAHVMNHLLSFYMEEFQDRQRVCDHVAGMTDGYAIRTFSELFLPRPLA
ncbi:MAG: deoxyguanosinetriphosphate triphosphohydrolase, partial [Clostridia bacterium]|nr:deoxyguanosinetriphosphate triphosphohydrolase [Clostridia bacterium]